MEENIQEHKNLNIEEKIEVSKIPNFTHLVLSGGGMMGAVYMGVFRYLYEEKNIIKNIKTVIGTSIGALFGAIFVLDIPLIEVEKFWKFTFDVNERRYGMDIVNIFSILDTMGLDNGRQFFQIIEKYSKITFLELAKKTGKDLIVCATNAFTMQPVYFSVNTTPNVLIYDAIAASCCIPIFLKPVNIGDIYYIDGGITDNIPTSCIPSHISSDNVLILNLESNEIIEMKELSLPIIVLNTMLSFVQNPSMKELCKKKFKYFISFSNIPVSSIPISTHEDKMFICTSIEKIDKCFELGYKTMYLKIKQWNNL